jgi:FkbM family methyltransferase
MLRSLAERLTHRVVLRRRLPEAFDRLPMYVSSEGGLRYLGRSLGDADPMLLDFADTHVHRGSVVWDIGANLGIFTMAAAAKAGPTGRVVAVEPDTWLVNLLRRSARANRDRTTIDVVPCAVGGHTGIEQFIIASRNRSTNYLASYGTTETGGERDRQFVPCFTLDDLLEVFPVPDVVKIDVEAAEIEALEGATKLLEQRPIVHIEVAGENAVRVAELFAPYGYDLVDGDTGIPCTVPTCNTVALPR